MLFALGFKVCCEPVPLAVLSKNASFTVKVTAPEVPPPDKPLPAVTPVMSPDSNSEYFASLCPPAVEPSWTLMVSKSVSTVISPTSPVNELCWAVVPLLHWDCCCHCRIFLYSLSTFSVVYTHVWEYSQKDYLSYRSIYLDLLD